MPPWLRELISRGRELWMQIPFEWVGQVARWVTEQARDRLEKNLSGGERKELTALMDKSRERPSDLSEKERRRFRQLLWKAVTGQER